MNNHAEEYLRGGPIKPGNEYYCKECDTYFIKGNVTCLVKHFDDTCCHYSDKKNEPWPEDELDTL